MVSVPGFNKCFLPNAIWSLQGYGACLQDPWTHRVWVIFDRHSIPKDTRSITGSWVSEWEGLQESLRQILHLVRDSPHSILRVHPLASVGHFQTRGSFPIKTPSYCDFMWSLSYLHSLCSINHMTVLQEFSSTFTTFQKLSLPDPFQSLLLFGFQPELHAGGSRASEKG